MASARVGFYAGLFFFAIMFPLFPGNVPGAAQTTETGTVLKQATNNAAIVAPTPEATVNNLPDGPYPIIQFAGDCQVQPQNETDKKNKFLRVNFDLGTLKQRESIERIIKFKNIGTADLNIIGVKPG